MSEIKLTPEQSAAVNAKGKVIVSASAGSGKTFVMIRRLTEALLSGVEMQDFLAVTFTNKAAAGMTEKLREALIKTINETEDEARKAQLKKKLSEIAMADISTIHSFCSRLLKRYFYELGVSDAFEIAAPDSAVGKAVFDEAMNNMLSAAYEEPDEDFLLLLKIFRSRRGSDKLIEAISEVYEKMRIYANYRELLENGGNFTEETFDCFCKGVSDEWKGQAREIEEELTRLYERYGFATPDCEGAYRFVKENLDRVLSAEDCFSCPVCVEGKKPTKGRATKGLSEEQLFAREEYHRLKNAADDLVKKEIAGASLGTREEELVRFLESGKFIRALYRYTLKFDEEYSALKREKSKLDYNDLEHYALELLKIDSVREAVRSQYRYVFVDEYQDVNPAQESILSAVSGEEVFLVGDKKQAIYSFRGGKSQYFSDKERQFGGGNLVLSANFRSAKNILSFVNEVFSSVMTDKTCGIDYRSFPMAGGERYGEYGGVVRVYAPEKEKEKKERTKPTDIYKIDECDDILPDYRSFQSETVYSIIRSSVTDPAADLLAGAGNEAGEYYDIDEGKKKRVRFQDIAVLVRSMSGKETRNIVNYLVQNGVPVTSLAEINVCDYPEVKRIVGVLEYLENPESDIPLCCALLSPLGGFTENELAEMRIFASDRAKDDRAKDAGAIPFRKACKLFLEEGEGRTREKLARFYAEIELLRRKTYILNASEILNILLADYGMETELLSKENGVNCMARVNRFVSECGEDSVHDFLKKLRNLGYVIKFTENSGEDSVKILTIHASKGLEYPVVILPDLNRPFHSDGREELLYDEDYGFVPKYYDLEKMVKQKTVFRLFASLRAKRRTVSDELNIFYVATTRAKYALHLVLDAPPKKEGKFGRYADFLSEEIFLKYRASVPPVPEKVELRDSLPLAGCASELDALREVYQKEYPYAVDENIAVKSSATTLLKKEGEEEEFYAVAHPFRAIEEPDRADMNVNADVGTAYHAFLEYADFASSESQYEKMQNLLPAEQFELLSKSKCASILSLPLLKKLSGYTLFKERKFIASFPADAFDEKVKSKDDVIYQGAIDLLAIGEDGTYVVDYKYSRRRAEDLREHYLPQIRLYKAVVAKLLKVEERTIKTFILNILRGEEILIDV